MRSFYILTILSNVFTFRYGIQLGSILKMLYTYLDRSFTVFKVPCDLYTIRVLPTYHRLGFPALAHHNNLDAAM
jgi:hypothetical protein